MIVVFISFRPSPRVPSALRPVFRCAVRGTSGSLASSSKRLIVMSCVIIGAVGLRASFQLWLSSQKTATVGDGYRPVVIAGMIAAGAGPRSPPLGTRGLFKCRCCVVVLRPRGRFWAAAGPVSNHGRQRPLTTHTHRGDNRRSHSMDTFAVRGGGYDDRGRHCCHLWPLVWAKYGRC